MPELLEVETYRQIADNAANRRIKSVTANDDWYLKKGLDRKLITSVLKGAEFTATRRIGKLLLMEVSNGHVVGLRFGMTGTLIVDSPESDVELVYGSRRSLPEWNRFVVKFDDGGEMKMNDPRRLGGVELDPDESKLGLDALSVKAKELRPALQSKAPLKARLMDQAHIAGVGNLIADETLWRGWARPRSIS